MDGVMEGGSGKEAGGVEGGEWGVGVVEYEGELCAAEDYGVAALVFEALDDLLEGGGGFGLGGAVDELV